MTNGQIEVITSVQRRRRWSRAEKERIVAAALEPGARWHAKLEYTPASYSVADNSFANESPWLQHSTRWPLRTSQQ